MKRDTLGGSGLDQGLTPRIWRLFWLVVLVMHVFLAVGWWWLEPGGFGFEHPRFWSNTVAPVSGLAVTLTALAALRSGWSSTLRWLLPIWASGWAAAALTGRILFPITLYWLWLVPLGGAVAMGVAAVPPWHGAAGRGRKGALIATLLAAIAGTGLVYAQRPPPANTHPRGTALATEESSRDGAARPLPGVIPLNPRATVYASDATVVVRFESLSLTIQPLVRFLSGSQDGCWSILAPFSDGPEQRLKRAERNGERSCLLGYDVVGQGPAELRARADAETGAISIDAATRLGKPVYSHLNGYCDIEVRGHHRLALAFSPCPNASIDVRPFDFPIGRPARFAFVQSDRTFRVVEASTGEKGPFHTLARGRLGADDSLAITLIDQDRPVGSITLADWAFQADTTLSPTTGWGMPVNAIEFSLSASAPTSPASIFITLAGTSVGRGLDCVGHRPGTYRNRVRCEPAGTTTQPGNRISVDRGE
jgi:hypothetical protein